MADPLFCRSDLGAVLARQTQVLYGEVDSLPEDQVLKTSPEDLCDYFVEKYRIDVPEIYESEIKVDYGDAQVDVSRRFEYVVFDRSSPTFVRGTRITFYVPFSGDSQLFQCRASTFSTAPPMASVLGGELVFVYGLTSQDVSAVGGVF